MLDELEELALQRSNLIPLLELFQGFSKVCLCLIWFVYFYGLLGIK